jgi:LemA protein
MFGWILLGLFVLPPVWALFTYNRLVRLRTLTAEAWSGIDAQFKRRADLIPNLVETVKGYAGHERATFDELTRLRSASQTTLDPAARAATEETIGSLLGRVIAVAEAYPELKASANFAALQHDLSEVEDQLQLARRYYNGTVRELNVAVAQFPSSLIAQYGGFREASFFNLEDPGERATPRVSFAS